MGICVSQKKDEKVSKQKEPIKVYEESQILKESFHEYSLSYKKSSVNIVNSICKINIKTQKMDIRSTGFFLKIDYGYFLISNSHIINNDAIQNQVNINISFYNERKNVNIKLEKQKRYIKNFKNFKDNYFDLDITAVQILDEDEIRKEWFLYPEPGEVITNKLINKQIYIPQYINGKEIVNSIGRIKTINKYEFMHLASTDESSSGSPIFLENSSKVIGIHKSSNYHQQANYAYFIYPAINIIKKDLNNRQNNNKSINKDYIWEDDKYYIGQIKNNLPNGKGTKYYSNGDILYEGDFINGKFEGNGKYFYENGECYVGQFKNNLKNGKGTEYYSNGTIKYEGEYINDKAEGNGKYILENGEYYIGQWKNDLPNGKGTKYYPNGKILYEGDYINDKAEGYGKYVYEDGEFYIGQWKDGLRNGEGKHYYSNGKNKYDGSWMNDEPEGYGKNIYEKGEYYEGQWKKGLPNGKGTYYTENGNIQSEGVWDDGELIGE